MTALSSDRDGRPRRLGAIRAARIAVLFRQLRAGLAVAPIVGLLWLAPGATVHAEDQSQPAAAGHTPAVWPAGIAAIDEPPGTEEFVAQILAHMTLEEKVGQMIQPDIAAVTPQEARDYHLGSVLAGGGAAPGGYVRTTPQAWLDLMRDFHRLPEAANGHVAIPLLFGIDAVHGHAKVTGATVFPHNVGLGAAHDPQLLRKIGAATAEEVAATGIDWAFAPTVAVVRDIRWGRSYESYSEAPALVHDYAAAMVEGLQGKAGAPGYMGPGRVLSSVKHFVGDGSTVNGRDQGDSIVPETLLAKVHGAGYEGALRAGALIVMASYNSWHGVKSHGNPYLLTDVLKGRMGFRGFVVGDWNAHEQIPGCSKYSCPAAITAGIDMFMAPDSWKPLLANTVAQVRDGTIPQARIDDAVTRILRVKALAGLFQRGGGLPPAGGLEVLGNSAHRELAREAVRRSLVLLKNNRHTLPLDPAAKVLVAGPGADDIGMQSGGWTIDWQGDHNRNGDFPGATSIYAGIRAAVAAGGGHVQLSPAGDFTERPDVAIVVFGETPYAEFQGDRETLAVPGDGAALALMARLQREHIPVIAVLLSGRPLWTNRELNLADAFVAAWLPGSEGAGIAELLFRARGAVVGPDFTGRLAFSWPASALPVRFDAAGRVGGALFARGYGLDYTHPRELGQLPEQAGAPLALAAGAQLYHQRHEIAPWILFVADGDEQATVHVTTAQQASPRGSITAQRAPDGQRLRWRGDGLGRFWFSGRPEDYRARVAAGEQLVLRLRVLEAPTAAVQLGLRCAGPYDRNPPPLAVPASPPAPAVERCGTASGAQMDITPLLRPTAHTGSGKADGWQRIAVPLRCLAGRDAVLSDVESPLLLQTTGRLELVIAEAGFQPGAAQAPCPGGV